jgi:hypothetical protein
MYQEKKKRLKKMLRNSLGPVKFMSIPLKTYHGALDGFIYYK